MVVKSLWSLFRNYFPFIITHNPTFNILRDFTIRWLNKHAIWLDANKGSSFAPDSAKGYVGHSKASNFAKATSDAMADKQDLALLVGYDTVPNDHGIKACRQLRSQIVEKPCKDKRGRPCKKDQVTWVCDLRFDQQIVLFSTNKGVWGWQKFFQIRHNI